MKLSESQLRNIIIKILFENKKNNPGAAVITYDQSDAVGKGIKLALGIDLPFKIGGGHSSTAIISPRSKSSGVVHGVNFGSKVCKVPPKGMFDMLTQEIGKQGIPVFASMTVTVKKLGTCRLENFKLKETGANQAAKLLKKEYHKGRSLTYVATNNVNPQAALKKAVSAGDCKTYSILPVDFAGLAAAGAAGTATALTGYGAPLSGAAATSAYAVGSQLGKYISDVANWAGIETETDMDNCASFGLDVISAGKLDFDGMIEMTQLLTAPSLVINTAMIAYLDSFKGSV